MPVIEMDVDEELDPDQKQRVAEAVADALRHVVPMPTEAVTVTFSDRSEARSDRDRQPGDGARGCPAPEDVVRRYLHSMEQRDIAAAESLLGEGFVMRFPGTAPMTRLAELLDWAAPRYRFVTKTYEGFDMMADAGGIGLVYCRGTLSGEWPDGTAFDGIRFIDRFEVAGGLITRQDVWNDIAEARART